MAKKKPKPSLVPVSTPVSTIIHEASLGANGSVLKGNAIPESEAVARRQQGLDVVVCGTDKEANRRLAASIEIQANGSARRCPPHANAGTRALPHYQPVTRPPQGHTFYETENRKAA